MDVLSADFIKHRYDAELARKELLTSALALPAGILSGLGSLLAYMARGFTYHDPTLTWTFSIVLTSAGIAFLACLGFLGSAYLAQSYAYLPLLQDLADARQQFVEFARMVGGIEIEMLEEFEKDIDQRIMRAADLNAQSNDQRSRFLQVGFRFLLFLGSSLSLASPT